MVKSTQLRNSMVGQEVVTVVLREPKEQVEESLVWRLYMVGRGQIRGSLVCHPEKLIFLLISGREPLKDLNRRREIAD